jgi:hypothetical protein
MHAKTRNIKRVEICDYTCSPYSLLTLPLKSFKQKVLLSLVFNTYFKIINLLNVLFIFL